MYFLQTYQSSLFKNRTTCTWKLSTAFCAEFLKDDKLQIFKYYKTKKSIRVIHNIGEKITCID